MGLVAFYPLAVADGMRPLMHAQVHLRIPLHYQTHGIDISHHNGTVDWQKATAYNQHFSSVKFCFLKATEGGDMVDETFQANWEELKSLHVKRGAYHYFKPHTDVRLQALNYILNVKFDKGDFVPVLDWEEEGYTQNTQELIGNVRQWLQMIEKHYGVKPIIYTNRIIYRKYIYNHFDDYPLWISHYNVAELDGYDLSNVYFWQYSMNGKVEGIQTPVDFNVFLKDKFDYERITFRQ